MHEMCHLCLMMLQDVMNKYFLSNGHFSISIRYDLNMHVASITPHHKSYFRGFCDAHIPCVM